MTHPASGILNRPPGHALVFALTLTATDATAARAALERLRELQRRELASDLDDTTLASDKNLPSAETGELGFDDGYDRAFLTITIGLGARAFDLLGVAPEERPQDLIDIPWQQLGDAPSIPQNGDVLVQACSDSVYINEHVLRRVQEELADAFTIAWIVAGHQRYNTRQGRVSRQEGRAVIGFLDGTSNLDPRHSEDDAALVFVNPDAVPTYPALPQPGQNPYGQPQGPQFPGDLRKPPPREPEWTRQGAYCTVRASVIDTARWDRETLGRQEHVIGRFKVSGASLDLADDPHQVDAPPAFAANPGDVDVPIDAHVRKANPRTADDVQRRIFRRGYPLVESTGTELRRGLVFVCFARSISTQFEFITRAWLTNAQFPSPNAGVDPLRGYEQVICGGYFFVPAITNQSRPWKWVLPDAAGNV